MATAPAEKLAGASTHRGETSAVILEPALKSLPAHAVFWIVAVFWLWLDLWSKQWAFSSLPVDGGRTWIDGWIDLHRSLNDGAVFGSFTGYTSVFIIASVAALGFVFYLFAHSDRRQKVLHVALAMILAGALGNLYDRAFVIADIAKFADANGTQQSVIGILQSEPDAQTVEIGSWPEGESPRRLDRGQFDIELRKQGVVRDFLRFTVRFPNWVPKFAGKEVWPWIFNVADAALVCGVAILLLTCIFDGRPKESAHS